MNVRLRSLFITLVSSTLLLSACSPGSTTSGETSQSSTAAATGANIPEAEPSPTPTMKAGALSITSSTDAALPGDPVKLSLENGTITGATVTGPNGSVEGTFDKDAWIPAKRSN